MRNQAWRYTPVIPILKWLRQEDCEFKTSLGNRKILPKKKEGRKKGNL
jgi:hypothetical protein